jgi:hypothetical protein
MTGLTGQSWCPRDLNSSGIRGLKVRAQIGPVKPNNSGTDRNKRLCEDSSCLVCEKTRARLLQSSRFHHLCRFISWESEELDERPHALFLTAARKSLGSCQLGDTMEARPKQFR